MVSARKNDHFKNNAPKKALDMALAMCIIFDEANVLKILILP